MASGGMGRRRPTSYEVTAHAGLSGTDFNAANRVARHGRARAGPPPGGHRVAVAHLDSSNKAGLLLRAGQGDGSTVTAYTAGAITVNPASPASQFTFDAFPGFTGGVFVG
jgi:hypothetical protein